jgi:hypothetical protein
MTATKNEKAEGVSQSPDVSDSETDGAVINEKALLRKLDAYLLPAVG